MALLVPALAATNYIILYQFAPLRIDHHGAQIAEIRTPAALAASAAAEALPEVEDEWDPFEDN